MGSLTLGSISQVPVEPTASIVISVRMVEPTMTFTGDMLIIIQALAVLIPKIGNGMVTMQYSILALLVHMIPLKTGHLHRIPSLFRNPHNPVHLQ